MPIEFIVLSRHIAILRLNCIIKLLDGGRMKDLKRLVEICRDDLDSLGFKYGEVRNWSVNTCAKCRLGQCKKVSFSMFDINISEQLLKDDIDDQITLDTIMHELLHTVSGCFNHGGKWKSYAKYIKHKLPQYNITCVAKESEIGLTIERKQPVYPYINTYFVVLNAVKKLKGK